MAFYLQQQCWNHTTRRAAARCPECAKSYCQECVTDYKGRVLCAACLKAHRASVAQQTNGSSWWRGGAWWAMQAAAFIVGLFLLWSTFSFAGHRLLEIPSLFHDAAVWEQLAGESEP